MLGFRLHGPLGRWQSLYSPSTGCCLTQYFLFHAMHCCAQKYAGMKLRKATHCVHPFTVSPTQPAAAPPSFPQKYKGIWNCLAILTRALGGNYVNFGVFELYGDPALKVRWSVLNGSRLLSWVPGRCSLGIVCHLAAGCAGHVGQDGIQKHSDTKSSL